MKKTILLVTVFFFALSLLASEPVIVFYMNDGNCKKYNISDIEEIVFGNKSEMTVMKIYYQSSQVAEFGSNTIDKILFEKDQSDILLLSIYIENMPVQFPLSSIDSISFIASKTPLIISIDPASFKVGEIIKITGTRFNAIRGTNFVAFNTTMASEYLKWNDTIIQVKVPVGIKSGKLWVNVNGIKSNETNFKILPYITGIEPSSARINDDVLIYGSGFGEIQGTSLVSFGTVNVVDYSSWVDYFLVVKVPQGAETGKITVTVDGNKSNEADFTVVPFPPEIKSIEPTSAPIGDEITIHGLHFGETQSAGFVSFGSTVAVNYAKWCDTIIRVIVPQGTETGFLSISVTTNDQKSSYYYFATLPHVISLIPATAHNKDEITIKGTSFGKTQGQSYVTFGTMNAYDFTIWTDTLITMNVPMGAETGKFSVSVNFLKSNEVDFTNASLYPPCTDDLKIGDQIWMCRNLDVCTYRNGDTIPQVKGDEDWRYVKTGAWCYLGNDTTCGKAFGKLYNWYAIHDPRGLAPVGWHIPAKSEWEILIEYLGGTTLAAAKLKETGTIHWRNFNPDATNESGFTALPGGYRGVPYYYDTGFHGGQGNWWTSSSEPGKIWYICIDNIIMYGDGAYETNGYSVRCIKD